MIEKTEFYRLIGAKGNIDSYLQWQFRRWYEKEKGTKPPFFQIVDVVRYPTTETITLRFDNDKGHQYTIPLSYMHDKDDTPPITMLWYSDYYDGPLSGLAEFKDEKVWFHCVEMEDPLFHMRKFALYKLTKDELAYEEKWHAIFNKLVGYHCDYGVDDSEKPQTTLEQHDEYFRLHEAEQTETDYTKNECLGIFDESFLDRKQQPEKSTG